MRRFDTGVLAGGEQRIPVAGVDAGQPELLGDLREAECSDAAGGVPLDVSEAQTPVRSMYLIRASMS